MCGIGGILRVLNPRNPRNPQGEHRGAQGSIPAAWLEALDRSIAHRGPDGAGTFHDRITRLDGMIVEVALVHRRLAIIDKEGGHQPMLASDRNPRHPAGQNDLLAVVFNGCVYNHRALRGELAAAGHAFQTDHSDTEVLLHGYRAWQDAMLGRLEGMFALALWDRSRARLVLARDRAGEKPLYALWAPGPHGESTFAFSSAVPGLASLAKLIDPSGRLLRLDPERTLRWLALGWDRHPPFESMVSIDPGSFAAGPGSGAESWTTRRYFSPPPRATKAQGDLASKIAVLDKQLEASVAQRLEADVPLGVFLSGGIDSSLIAAYARRHTSDLTAYTMRPDVGMYDESHAARSIARRLAIRHVTLPCPGKPGEDLATLIGQLGLPLGDSSILPTLWVSRAMKAHAGVALAGDGGDELFGGYDRYRVAAWLDRSRGLGATRALGFIPPWFLERGHPRSKRSRLARLGVAARGWGYADLLAVFPSADLRDLLDLKHLPPPPFGPIEDAPRFDFEHTLPDGLLRKVDTASMAVALEVRCPMLATPLIETGLATPLRELMPQGQRKGLLRALARRFLPLEITQRPKQGFAVPVDEWFRRDHAGLRTMLLDLLNTPALWEPLRAVVPLSLGRARALVDEHTHQRRPHGQRLFALLSMGLWCRGFVR